ncbi:MAG: prepilin-type N-terminal cleavage/methylation domain-containing protein [Planctomycetota bacterium]
MDRLHQPAAGERGFTLVEALVALGIVATVVITYIGIRTSALIDATYARNWRLARELAEQKMSELQAGARETAPESGAEVPFEDYRGWSFKIVVGEARVANLEAELGADAAGDDSGAAERIDWQRDRYRYRKAQSRGLTAAEYDEQQYEDVEQRLAEKAPSATEFEEVGVVVFFPKLEGDYEGQKDALLIKARVSTLALSSKTPEQAAAIAQSLGQTPGQPGAATPGAAGQPAGGGNSSGAGAAGALGNPTSGGK